MSQAFSNEPPQMNSTNDEQCLLYTLFRLLSRGGGIWGTRQCSPPAGVAFDKPERVCSGTSMSIWYAFVFMRLPMDIRGYCKPVCQHWSSSRLLTAFIYSPFEVNSIRFASPVRPWNTKNVYKTSIKHRSRKNCFTTGFFDTNYWFQRKYAIFNYDEEEQIGYPSNQNSLPFTKYIFENFEKVDFALDIQPLPSYNGNVFYRQGTLSP